MREPGVRDQAKDRSVGGDALLDRRGNRGGIGDVGGRDAHIAAERLGGFHQARLGAAQQGQGEALAVQALGDRPANAGACARHHNVFAICHAVRVAPGRFSGKGREEIGVV